jgi:hypothetical protein
VSVTKLNNVIILRTFFTCHYEHIFSSLRIFFTVSTSQILSLYNEEIYAGGLQVHGLVLQRTADYGRSICINRAAAKYIKETLVNWHSFYSPGISQAGES